MTHDEQPWLAVAKEIIAGKWDAWMDGSTRESLIIGLQSIKDDTCAKALKRLKKK